MHRCYCFSIVICALVGCDQLESETANSTKSTSSKSGAAKQEPTNVSAKPIAQADFPVPEGAKFQDATPSTRTLMWRGPNTLSKYIAFYEQKLKAAGWKKSDAKSEPDNGDGVGYLVFEKGGLEIGITMNPSRDGTTMAIFAQGSGVEVPAEKDE